MGLFSKLGRLFKNVVECPDKYAKDLFYIAPIKRNNIKLGANLFVRENFTAVLMVKEKVTDMFLPGKHKLILAAMPLTARRVNFNTKKNKKPKEYFKGEIYFINLNSFLLSFTGIESAILKTEKQGKVKVRANGEFNFHIENAKAFLEVCFMNWAYIKPEVVKNKLSYWINLEMVKMLEYLNPPLLEFAKNNEYLSERIFGAISKKFISYGLLIESFKILETFIPNKYALELQEEIKEEKSLLVNDTEKDTAYIKDINVYTDHNNYQENREQYEYLDNFDSSIENNDTKLQKESDSNVIVLEEPVKNNEETKTCSYCGRVLAKDALACYNCGQRQVKVRICPNCKVTVAEGEFVCPNCKNIII